VGFQPSYISIDTSNCDAFLADAFGAPLPLPNGPPDPFSTAVTVSGLPAEPTDAWTAHFARALQAQHTRVREFLQAQRDRWRQAEAHFTRHIETLQGEVHALEAANEVLQQELSRQPAQSDLIDAAEELSPGDSPTADEVRDLKERNAQLQRQLLEFQTATRRDRTAPPVASDANWEAQKRRFLANLDSDTPGDPESTNRRLKIEEIVARTDKIIAEKNCEIEELRYLLENQSSSLGALAVGAAALEQVFDQDALILEERHRLQQLQDECRDKLRQAEIEIAVERARLARRDVEVEEKMRASDVRHADGEPEALAPTGRPVHGRWRAQLGLTDDDPPDAERRERR
jgi:hypothetical protein